MKDGARWVRQHAQLNRYMRRLDVSTTARRVRRVYGPPLDPAKQRAEQVDNAVAVGVNRERAIAEGRR